MSFGVCEIWYHICHFFTKIGVLKSKSIIFGEINVITDVEAWKLSGINKLCALLNIWDSFYVTLMSHGDSIESPFIIGKKECKTCVDSFVSIFLKGVDEKDKV